ADEKITKNDLINYGLIGGIDSKNLREVLGERLRIGSQMENNYLKDYLCLIYQKNNLLMRGMIFQQESEMKMTKYIATPSRTQAIIKKHQSSIKKSLG